MNNENLLTELLSNQEKILGKYKKSIWQCCVFFALPLFFYLYKMPEVVGSDSKIRKELKNLERKINIEEAIFNDKDKIKNDNAKFKETLSKLVEKKLKKTSTSNYLSKISKIAKETNIEIENFLPKEKERKDDFLVTKLEVSIAGNFHNILSFWAKIGNLENIILIKEFKLGEQFLDKNELKIKGNFILNIYEI